MVSQIRQEAAESSVEIFSNVHAAILHSTSFLVRSER